MARVSIAIVLIVVSVVGVYSKNIIDRSCPRAKPFCRFTKSCLALCEKPVYDTPSNLGKPCLTFYAKKHETCYTADPLGSGFLLKPCSGKECGCFDGVCSCGPGYTDSNADTAGGECLGDLSTPCSATSICLPPLVCMSNTCMNY